MADTILVVEDEAPVARGLEYGLRAEGFAVAIAANGRRALELAREQQVRLVLLDIRLPDMSGFDVCRALREAGMTAPIIMLTARDEEVDKVLGLELGADDYVVKPFSLRELVSRIRAALRRAYGELAAAAEPAAEGTRHAFGDVTIDAERMRVEKGGAVVWLTPTEYRLLLHLASNPDRIHTRDSLLEIVWGYDPSVDSQRTVDVHVRHLREKLEDDPAHPRWLRTVRGVGYLFSSKGE
jgi:two-component system response regulator VicR